MDVFVFVLEIIGTVAFAVSGAIKGVRKNMDVLGVTVMGIVTAVGGGIIRDAMLGNGPAKIFSEPVFAYVAAAASIFVFVFYRIKRKRLRVSGGAVTEWIFISSDALGLGVFTAIGVNTALGIADAGSVFMPVLVGVVTGCGGGVLRDIMCAAVPDVFVKHIYVCASVAGALVCACGCSVMGESAAMQVGAAVVAAVRILSAALKLNLPKAG